MYVCYRIFGVCSVFCLLHELQLHSSHELPCARYIDHDEVVIMSEYRYTWHALLTTKRAPVRAIQWVLNPLYI